MARKFCGATRSGTRSCATGAGTARMTSSAGADFDPRVAEIERARAPLGEDDLAQPVIEADVGAALDELGDGRLDEGGGEAMSDDRPARAPPRARSPG